MPHFFVQKLADAGVVLSRKDGSRLAWFNSYRTHLGRRDQGRQGSYFSQDSAQRKREWGLISIEDPRKRFRGIVLYLAR